MADNWESAWVEVLPDFSDFKRTANGTLTGILGGAGTAGGLAAGKNINGGILGAIPKLALPLVGAVAALGIGNLIGDAISSGIRFALGGVDLASDLAESANAIKVSFGDVSSEIETLSEGTAKRLGLTKTEFNGIATQFSAFSKTIGSRGGGASKVIDDLTSRGADFASVYNLDVPEALSLFQSGLAGETEPLRKYGIDLSAASVASFAYANGIAAQGKQLTETQRVQAAYGLLMQQTDQTSGDFKNTSGGLANQQRILAASFEEAQTKLGTALLPTITEFTKIANDDLIPILNDVVEEVGPVLADALKESAPAFKDLVTELAPLIPDLVKLAVDVLPPLLSAFTSIAADVGAFAGYLSALFDLLQGDITLAEFVERLKNLPGAFGEVISGLVDFGTGVGFNLGLIINAVHWFHDRVKETFANVVGFFVSLPGIIGGAVSGFGSLLVESGRSLIDGFIRGIDSMLAPVRRSLTDMMDFVAGFFPHSPAEHGPFAGAGWTAIADSGRAIITQLGVGLGDRPDDLLGRLALPSLASASGMSTGTSSGTTPSASRIMLEQNVIGVTDPLVVANLAAQQIIGKLRFS